MTETITTPRLTVVSAIGAPVIAFLMFVVGTFLAGVVVTLAFALFGASELVLFIKGLITTAIGTWVARRSTDVVFKVYSGRGVFIVFLVLAVVLAMSILVGAASSIQRLSSLTVLAAFVAFTYWAFWRRDQRVETGVHVVSDDGERRGLHRLWEPLVPIIGALPTILFILGGLIQLFAVSAQVHSFTHLPGFLSTLVAFFLSYIPLVGSLVGYFGAKDVWGWEWWQAALLVFGPMGLALAFSLLGSVVGAAVGGVRGRLR